MFANRRFAALFRFCQGFVLLAIVLSLLGAAPSTVQASSTLQLLTPADRAILTTLTPKLGWTAVPGAGYYVLTIATDQDFTQVVLERYLPGTSYTVPFSDDLQYGLTYYWFVTAFMTNMSLPAQESLARRFTLTVQKTPSDGSYLTTVTPTFTWLAVSGAINYDLYLAHTNNPSPVFSSVPTYSGLQLKYTVPAPVSPADNYGTWYWKVCVTLSTGQIECPVVPSNKTPWVVTLTPPPLSAPLLKSPADKYYTNDNTPTFSWQLPGSNPLAGPWKYQFQYDTLPTFSHPKLDTFTYHNGDPTDLQVYSPAGSLPDAVYYWRVRAINIYNVAGKWSAARQFTIDTQQPPFPVLLSPLDHSITTNHRPAFKWTKVPGAAYYELKIAGLIDKNNLTTTSYTLNAMETLTDGNYTWFVYAFDAAGNMSMGSIETFTFTIADALPPGVPAKPKLISPNASATINFSPSFDWTPSDKTLLSEIQVSDDAAFRYYLWNASGLVADINSGIAHKDWGAWSSPADGKYYWRIRSYNGSVSSLWSEVRSFEIKTSTPTAPALLSPPNTAIVSGRRPTFKWSASPGLVSYVLNIADDSLNYQQIHTTQTSYTPPANLPYGSISWSVDVIDVYGNTTNGLHQFSFCIPIQNSPPLGTVTTNTQPTFKWAAVSGATNYRVHLMQSEPVVSTRDFDALTATSYTPADWQALSPGAYTWQVIVTGVTVSPPAWYDLYIQSATLPAAPLLLAPADKTLAGPLMPPEASWKNVAYAQNYQVQISPRADFSNSVEIYSEDYNLPSTSGADISPSLYAPPLNQNWTYYWRVCGINSDGLPGKWSAVRTFVWDQYPPGVPQALSPGNSGWVTNPQFSLAWSAVPDAAGYDILLARLGLAYDTQPTRLGNVTSYKLPYTLQEGDYYWDVRAYDAAGNTSQWYSDVYSVMSFTIIAGQSVPKTPTPSATPTIEPSLTPSPEEPTVEPSSTPAPEEPTTAPSATPAPEEPTAEPTIEPSAAPTEEPTLAPTDPPALPEPSATPEP